MQSYKQARDGALLAELEKKLAELKVNETLKTVNGFLGKQAKRGLAKRFVLATKDAAEMDNMDKVRFVGKVYVSLD